MTLLLSLLFLTGQAQSRWDFGVATSIGFSGHKDQETTSYTTGGMPVSTISTSFAVTYEPVIYTGFWTQYALGTKWALRASAGVRHVQIENFSTLKNAGTITTETHERLGSREFELALPLQLVYYLSPTENRNRWYVGAGVEMNYLLAQWRSWLTEYSDGTGGGGYWSTTERIPLKDGVYGPYYGGQDLIRWRGMGQLEVGWQRGRTSLSLLGSFAIINGKRYAAQPGDCFNDIWAPGIRSRRWRSLSLRLSYDLKK